MEQTFEKQFRERGSRFKVFLHLILYIGFIIYLLDVLCINKIWCVIITNFLDEDGSL